MIFFHWALLALLDQGGVKNQVYILRVYQSDIVRHAVKIYLA